MRTRHSTLELVSVRLRGTQARRINDTVKRVPQGVKPKIAERQTGGWQSQTAGLPVWEVW